MSNNANRIREQVLQVYGREIAAYARGSDALERSAVHNVEPAIAALTLPEEYAAIVLTSRMDNDLRKMIERVLHRHGNPDKLLFDHTMGFGTFSAKIAAAYSFGFITKKMHEAITCCRKIRNEYAHADNPDDARSTEKYIDAARRLMCLEPGHTQSSVEKFRELHVRCTGIIEVVSPASDVSAMMLSICENLGSAAFFSLGAAFTKLQVVSAFFGPEDAIASIAALTPEGESPTKKVAAGLQSAATAISP